MPSDLRNLILACLAAGRTSTRGWTGKHVRKVAQAVLLRPMCCQKLHTSWAVRPSMALEACLVPESKLLPPGRHTDMNAEAVSFILSLSVQSGDLRRAPHRSSGWVGNKLHSVAGGHMTSLCAKRLGLFRGWGCKAQLLLLTQESRRNCGGPCTGLQAAHVSDGVVPVQRGCLVVCQGVQGAQQLLHEGDVALFHAAVVQVLRAHGAMTCVASRAQGCQAAGCSSGSGFHASRLRHRECSCQRHYLSDRG